MFKWSNEEGLFVCPVLAEYKPQAGDPDEDPRVHIEYCNDFGNGKGCKKRNSCPEYMRVKNGNTNTRPKERIQTLRDMQEDIV